MFRNVLLLMFFLCLGCQEKAPKVAPEIILPPTPIITNSTNWAVLSDPYSKLLRERDNPSEVITTCRKGDVLEVFEVYREKEGEPVWLYVEFQGKKGWIPRQGMRIFENKEQAETSALDL